MPVPSLHSVRDNNMRGLAVTLIDRLGFTQPVTRGHPIVCLLGPCTEEDVTYSTSVILDAHFVRVIFCPLWTLQSTEEDNARGLAVSLIDGLGPKQPRQWANRSFARLVHFQKRI